MGRTILPSGEEISVTPEEILRYLNPDGLRQLLRQERLHWHLKPNRDADYYDNQTLYKFAGMIHNEGSHSRVEIRTYPDNGAYEGYAGMYVDSGMYGLVHNLDKWDRAISQESLHKIVNRVMIGAMAKIPEKRGYGLDDDNQMTSDTDNRIAAFVFDPWDGRALYMSNDDPTYVNNENRAPEEKLPDRAVARICDVPTRITQLKNDLDFVSDPDYRHTDNNFTNSNRFVLDNLDDRTFVYPEISRDTSGNPIENKRIGLNGLEGFAESDGSQKVNSQSDPYNDRQGDRPSSYNVNENFSGSTHSPGFMPGIFRSLEELQKVDLIGQKVQKRTNRDTPGGSRPSNFYNFDGQWSPTWFDRTGYDDSYKSQPLNPVNMEVDANGSEPVPYAAVDQTTDYSTNDLYQWRYNRVTMKYESKNIKIDILQSGEKYKEGDILRWSFGDDVFLYEVTKVGDHGQIIAGHYKPTSDRIFEQDPSTHGVGISFTNMSGVGRNAKLTVSCKVTIETIATQIKNNLYAYVDVTPTVRSENDTEWSDVNAPDTQGGRITIRSTAAGPGYTGINSGRGGPAPSGYTSNTMFYEHGGNATAGVHVHLFRYVINTQNPTWVERDGIRVYTGRWVDQGPMGVQRPCDIKALLFSNFDTNNFNNYYKFMLDSMVDNLNRDPDGVNTNNPNAVCTPYIHVAQRDPEPNQRFTEWRISSTSCTVEEVDITDRVLYINAATGIQFMYNSSYKNDPSFGYGARPVGWYALVGAVAR